MWNVHLKKIGINIADFANMAKGVFMGKAILLSSLFTMMILFPTFSPCSSLDIKNFNEDKNVFQNNSQVLYKKIFTQSFRKINLSQTDYFIQENVSTSLTSMLMQNSTHDHMASQATDQAWSHILDFFKKNLQNTLLPLAEAGSLLPLQMMPNLGLFPSSIHVSPKLKMGRDYIKPSLSIENASLITTHISYHSRDKFLETQLSKHVSKDLELMINNTNTFSSNNDEKKITFGFKYKFQ